MTLAEAARASRLAYAYLCAREFVLRRGYAKEVEWQRNLCLDTVTESDFLREAAWVVMAGGMREAVVRQCFVGVTNAFRQWASAKEIVANRVNSVRLALLQFNHRRKIGAIADIAAQVDRLGFSVIRNQLRARGAEYLTRFPFIGPVTSYHLAKNLGVDIVKPDRHLLRVAAALAYPSPEAMCRELAAIVEEKVSVIDLIIWRYATLTPNYLALFTRLIQQK